MISWMIRKERKKQGKGTAYRGFQKDEKQKKCGKRHRRCVGRVWRQSEDGRRVGRQHTRVVCGRPKVAVCTAYDRSKHLLEWS